MLTKPSLAQIIACREFDAKPLIAAVLLFCQLDLIKKNELNSNKNATIFIDENAL